VSTTGTSMSTGRSTSTETFASTEMFASIGPYTGATLSAEYTMATFGTGAGGISGMAVGMRTALAHAGFTLTACGSGILRPVHFEATQLTRRNIAREAFQQITAGASPITGWRGSYTPDNGREGDRPSRPLWAKRRHSTGSLDHVVGGGNQRRQSGSTKTRAQHN
jgi:hypothetical protein